MTSSRGARSSAEVGLEHPATQGFARRTFFLGVDFSVRAGRYALLRARAARKSVYYGLRGNVAGRRILRAAAFAAAPREITVRRNLARQLRIAHDRRIDRRAGYRTLAPDFFPDIDSVIATCRALHTEDFRTEQRSRRLARARRTAQRRSPRSASSFKTS
jgi:hypothetical protein